MKIYSKIYYLSLLAILHLITGYFLVNSFRENNNLNENQEIIDHKSLSSSIKDKLELKRIEKAGLKSVQTLTNLFDSETWEYGKLGTTPFEKCAEKRCFAFKHNLNWQTPLEESNGVIVHAPNLLYLYWKNNQYKRDPKQLWSLYTLESQMHTFCYLHFKLSDLDDWFNLTKTIKDKYGYNNYDLKQLHRYKPYVDYFSGLKTLQHKPIKNKKMALWFVSNCHSSSKRNEYIAELSKYIEIDVFGNCGFLNSKKDPCKSKSNIKCLKELFNSYKFYLSFENSNCDSYITEKYLRFYEKEFVFEVDIVPVVRGTKLEQYLEKAPSNHSFIYVDSFKSPRSLAEYLSYLDRNQTAYLEYFEWKNNLLKKLNSQSNVKNKNEYIEPYRFSPFCDLCEKLHDNEYLNNRNNPTVKLSRVYNPVLDCSDDIPKENFFTRTFRQSCNWAEYNLKPRLFWQILTRLFKIF